MAESARAVALRCLKRIETGGAYANLLVKQVLDTTALDGKDRRFVTELVYGTTRMQRTCDYLVDQFLTEKNKKKLEQDVRLLLRLGAYQLYFLKTPPHAGVGETVALAPKRVKGLLNAVLRKVAGLDEAVTFPSLAVELSYPDWIVESIQANIGVERGEAALRAMNQPAKATERDDGYFQDLASQWVVESFAGSEGELVLDMCAAPGGKATGLAARGFSVVASDIRLKRVELTAKNVAQLGSDVAVVAADGANLPFSDNSFDHVLLDAPCSGLGSLRRRADARWRIDKDAPQRLAKTQNALIASALRVLKPGGTLTYSVCTLTKSEGEAVLEQVLESDVKVTLLDPPQANSELKEQLETRNGVTYLYPEESDAMMLFQLRIAC